MVVFDTALGRCGVDWSDVGVTKVLLPGTRRLDSGSHHGADDAPQTIREAIAGIVGLLRGEHVDLRGIVLDERRIDPFHRRVYSATREIPPGATASYGEIARAIGEPDAARDVGGALARNPFPIIVPCHRVLAATGALHGFSAPGGLATKRQMLAIERAPGFTQEALFA